MTAVVVPAKQKRTCEKPFVWESTSSPIHFWKWRNSRESFLNCILKVIASLLVIAIDNEGVGPPVSMGTIGVRINPLVGLGSIEALSTAASTSKFGIPLNDANSAAIVALFREHSWLTAVMSHVGSQVQRVVIGCRAV